MGDNGSEIPEAIGSLLLDENGDVARTARYALLEMNAHALPALPYILTALQHSNTAWIKCDLMSLLYNLGENAADAAPLLMDLAKGNRDYYHRHAQVLWKIGRPAFPALRKGLLSEDRYQMACALSAIGRMESNASEMLPDVCDFLKRDQDWAVGEMQYIFRFVFGEASIPCLLDTLKSDHEGVRSTAVLCLAYFDDSNDVSAPLEKAFNDKSAKVRRAVLSAIDCKEVEVELCIRALGDADGGVKLCAARRLLAKGVVTDKSEEILLSSLNTPTGDSFKTIVTLTRHAGEYLGQEYIPIFEDLLNDANDKVRERAVLGLGNFRERAHTSEVYIRPLVMDNSPAVRQTAVRTLEEIGYVDDATIGTIVESLRFGRSCSPVPCHPTASNSLCALRRLGERAVPFLEDALDHENENVRTISKEILKYISEKSKKK